MSFTRIAALLLAVFLVHCSSPASEAGLTTPASGHGSSADDPSSTSTTDSANLPAGSVDGGTTGAGRVFADALADSPPGQWTWYGDDQFDGKPACMDGTKTGLGISRSPNGSKKVLIWMRGGGACFSPETCAISDYLLPSADHADATDFATWAGGDGNAAVLNRTAANNPFKDWNYVYIPYCSGDVFAGNAPSGYDGRTQIGFENVAAYLPRLQSTFRNTDQLVLTGESAGGYGAFYNYVQVQKSFDWLDISMVDDSAPPLSPQFTQPCLAEQWKTTWKMDTTSPVDGPYPLGFDETTGQAGGGLIELVKRVLTEHPKSKFAFLSHDSDLVMRFFHGIGNSLTCSLPDIMGADDFAAGLREISTTLTMPNFSTYYAPGTTHMFFSSDDNFDATSADGIKLVDWLAKFATDGTQEQHAPANF